jgi:hypothetical protein
MIFNIEPLHSSLVKIKSKLIGTGVWLNLGFTEHSYVLTAEHNINGKDVEVFDRNGVKLESTYLCSLAGLDIAIIRIEGRCNSQVEFCLEDTERQDSQTTCWILGYPEALAKELDFNSIDHQGTILLNNGHIFFRIDDELPKYADKSNIKGFSGGPIFEVSKGITYLKGIITDVFDEDFSYQRIYGKKSSDIYAELPEEVKIELACQNSIQSIISQSCEKLDGKIGEYILESDLLKKLDSINLDELKGCKYFYLPDDKARETQHLSLLRNKTTVESYIHSRILSLMMDEHLLGISSNPSKFENKNIFTIHVTNFTKAHLLVAKLIRQENSMDFSNAIVMVIYSNENNDLKYFNKKRISQILANFAEGTEPELYNKKAPFRERGQIKNFLETRKSAGLKFAVINIKYLIENILAHIENDLCDEEYNKDVVKQKVIRLIRTYE